MKMLFVLVDGSSSIQSTELKTMTQTMPTVSTTAEVITKIDSFLTPSTVFCSQQDYEILKVSPLLSSRHNLKKK